MSGGIIHTVYFVRHGQCRGNVTGETLSPEDDVITEFGRKQSAELGKALKDVPFTRTISSHYQRSSETVVEMLKQSLHPVPKLEEDPRVKERDMGDLLVLGMTAKDIGLAIIGQLQEGKKFDELEVPGGESVLEYETRIRSFFQELFSTLSKSDKSENVLIVSHGLIMTRFLTGLRNSFADLCTVAKWDPKCATIIKNTACTKFTLEFLNGPEEKPVLTFVSVNSTDHLEELNKTEEAVANKSSFNMNDDDKRKMMEMIMQIPGAKEQVSGCLQV